VLGDFFVRDYLGFNGLAGRACRLRLLQALLARQVSE
jgi:hypothetical protein